MASASQGRSRVFWSGITDYLDPVLNSRHLPAILDLLTNHLSEDSDWEVCDWQDLSGENSAASARRHKRRHAV